MRSIEIEWGTRRADWILVSRLGGLNLGVAQKAPHRSREGHEKGSTAILGFSIEGHMGHKRGLLDSCQPLWGVKVRGNGAQDKPQSSF
jgi:hypothetical protein